MAIETKPRKPQARTALTRARILEAAAHLSKKKSLEEMTAEVIAREAGVAKGTIFAHFGDMDGLLSYLLLGELQKLREAADKNDKLSAQDLTDPVGGLVNRMMALIAVITESQTMLRVFLENIGATKGHCAPEFIEQLDALDEKLLQFLGFWQLSDEITPKLRSDRSPQEMLDGLVAFVIHGAIIFRSHQLTDLKELQSRLERHVEAFLVRP
ncbi:TetR family transcriptional regulator [Alphaproteobacteria bacterium AO1-B]|nr:TetR family transcriptional regulator [Alphaproteobacteria bacterium AO1-B]